MNWKKISTFIAFCAVSVGGYAQANLLNAKTAADIGVKEIAEIIAESEAGPIPYGYVADKDILFATKVWETIPLDEAMNAPYYYPTDEVKSEGRKSLFQVLIEGIKSGQIEEVFDDSDFKTKRTLKDLESAFTKIDTTDVGREYYNAGEEVPEEYIVKEELQPHHVKEYHIVGMWYFDRSQGELKYRLLGICPVVPDIYTLGSENENYVELFWIFYPGAREVLHKNYAFNERNPFRPINFDHMLNSRRFSATIYKTDNVYGDRRIDDYIQDNAVRQLLESERIKESIRNLEDDMWNY